MGLLGLLEFAFKFFDLLAWPLFGLGFPLYASIRAIENNSNSEMRNLVAYWIIFSLDSLFELVFLKLNVWLPFWPYMKLMAIFWLALPHFSGAAYVYDCLLRPWLSVTPRVLIKHFIKSTKDLSLSTESFLSVVEKYVQENGSEALEKLIDRKWNDTKPNIDVEEIKAVTNTQEKEMAATIQSKFKEPSNVAKEDASVVEPTDKNPAAATKWSKLEDPNVAEENSLTGKLERKNPVAAIEGVSSHLVFGSFTAAIEGGECVVKDLAETENRTVLAHEFREKTVAAAGGENKVVAVTDTEKVQKEWTCALCQVTTSSEKDLKSHLRGMKHRARYVELKASKQVTKNKGSSSSAANHEPKKPISVERPNQNKSKKKEDKSPVKYIPEFHRGKEVNNPGSGMNQSRYYCNICNVQCSEFSDLASHLGGQMHSVTIQSLIVSLGGGLK